MDGNDTIAVATRASARRRSHWPCLRQMEENGGMGGALHPPESPVSVLVTGIEFCDF